MGVPEVADFGRSPVIMARAAVIRDEKVLTGSIFGSAHTHRDFVEYAELHAAGRLPIDRLITGRYRLAQINEACHEMLNGVAGRGVVVF